MKGTSWNAYNWYKGGYHSLIQVNTDLPIAIDRAIDLACHEGYPGHHVYNALIEETLVNGRGWVEFALYPLYSPQSLIAEGSANLGIDMAFPGAGAHGLRARFALPARGARSGARGEERRGAPHQRAAQLRAQRGRSPLPRRAARPHGAEAAMARYWLSTPEAAAKTVRFIDTYRSYVID